MIVFLALCTRVSAYCYSVEAKFALFVDFASTTDLMSGESRMGGL
jgi:hypothetical protein